MLTISAAGAGDVMRFFTFVVVAPMTLVVFVEEIV